MCILWLIAVTTMGRMAVDSSFPQLITLLLAGQDLTPDQATWAMDSVMEGSVDPIALGGFLIALKAKGEKVEEIEAFTQAIISHALPINVTRETLDIVGTGGDRSGTVNISSMSALVIAAAGVPVLKHGNRAASSRSGSSDFFEALGVDLQTPPERVAEIFDKVGIGFCFAGLFHPGFRHAAATRKALGVPTVFNFLGPLCNPGRPRINAIGVAAEDRVQLVAGLLANRGDTALVFRGADGLDEMSTTGLNSVWQVSNGQMSHFTIDPQELGFAPAELEDLVGGDAATNVAISEGVFAGEPGSVRDVVLLNSAAGLVAALLYHEPETADQDLTERFANAVEVAAEAIDSGAAAAKRDQWLAEFTN